MYKVIYADPAWSYDNKKTGGSHSSGAAQQYDVMSVEEIKALPVQDLTTSDTALFLWATNPLLHEALHVVEAWGFQYKGLITWVKTGRLGMGYWVRVNTEHLIYAVKPGAKAWRSSQRTYVEAPTEGHSVKPEVFRDLIMELCPEGPYLEMFARRAPPGWDVWGNEAPGSILWPDYGIL